MEERASIWCLRHHGYASASQIVSMPASSSTRAVASISPTGSIVSCMTPMRNGGTRPILAVGPLKRRCWRSNLSPNAKSGPCGPLVACPVELPLRS